MKTANDTVPQWWQMFDVTTNTCWVIFWPPCIMPGQLSLAIPPWVGAVSSSESWDVNRHTARCTSPVSVVWQCKLVSGWGLMKRRSAPPCGPYGSEGLYVFHTCIMPGSKPVARWVAGTLQDVFCRAETSISGRRTSSPVRAFGRWKSGLDRLYVGAADAERTEPRRLASRRLKQSTFVIMRPS